MSSDENENTGDMNNAIKQFVPSLVLFIIGAVVGFLLIGNSEGANFVIRLVLSLVMGWVLGGTVLGWYKTRSMFKPNVPLNTYTSPSSIIDHRHFFQSIKLPIRIICAIIVGIFLMPVEFIKFIIAIFKYKKRSNTINANRSENE